MKVLVAVIAYNEEANIGQTLQTLQDAQLGYDVVVIDNGSSDGTVAVCEKMGVPVISHCINTGSSYGTVRSYFLYAFLRGYDVLCQFDGDGQHLPAELPKIVSPVASGEADYVIGSRFLKKEGYQSSAMRRIGIRLFASIDSFFTGLEVTDVTSGFRSYSRDVIRFYARHYRHEITDTSQLLLMAHFAGARVTEVPVVMKEREHGQSEFNLVNSVSFILYGLVNALGSVLQRKNVKNLIRS